MYGTHRKHRNILAAGLVLIASLSSGSFIDAAAIVDLAAHQKFADELTSILYTNENECTSALGVSMAFSLIYPGSTGNGIDEIRDTLGYPSGSNLQLVWNDTTQDMLASADGQCAIGGDHKCLSYAPLLQIANSIWFHNVNALHPDYEAVVGTFAKQINFEADNSPVLVNEWVNNSTNGLIKSIVDPNRPIYPPIELVAINSIYLKASWAARFTKSMTNLDSFYSSISRNTEVSKAHFMNGVFGSLPYSHNVLSGYQIVQLPFFPIQMSMVFVLPLSDDAEPLSTSKLLPILPALYNLEYITRVALSIPKFKFESKYEENLKHAVIQAGIVAPFKGGALCGLFEDESGCEALVIDDIIQKTVIGVNEEGVEAAALSAIMPPDLYGPIYTSEPVLMVLDHPFQFFIYDKTQGLVLFEGRLGLPEVPQNEPEVELLDAAHSDEDFWSKAFNVDPVDPPMKFTTTSSTSATGGSNTTTKPSSTSSSGCGGSNVTLCPYQPTSTPSSPSPRPASNASDGRIRFSLVSCLFLCFALGFAL